MFLHIHTLFMYRQVLRQPMGNTMNVVLKVIHPRCVGFNYQDSLSESNANYECIILFTWFSLEVTPKLHHANKIIHS